MGAGAGLRAGAGDSLRDVGLGKYAGRVIADVFTEDGRRLADVLIEAGLARVYDGGVWEGWCE